MTRKKIAEKYGITAVQQSQYCRYRKITLPSKIIDGRRVTFWPDVELKELLEAFGVKK